MTNALIIAAVILLVVFAVNLLRARRMQPNYSTVRLVPGALFLTEAFVLRIVAIAFFALAALLSIFTILVAIARPR